MRPGSSSPIVRPPSSCHRPRGGEPAGEFQSAVVLPAVAVVFFARVVRFFGFLSASAVSTTASSASSPSAGSDAHRPRRGPETPLRPSPLPGASLPQVVAVAEYAYPPARRCGGPVATSKRTARARSCATRSPSRSPERRAARRFHESPHRRSPRTAASRGADGPRFVELVRLHPGRHSCSRRHSYPFDEARAWRWISPRASSWERRHIPTTLL
jgi:hypothetical protein